MLVAMLLQAEAVPDAELWDSDMSSGPKDRTIGGLDGTEQRILTIIFRKIDRMDALKGRAREDREQGKPNTAFLAGALTEGLDLADDLKLLCRFLFFRVRKRLDIENDITFVFRKGWRVVQVVGKTEKTLEFIFGLRLSGKSTRESGLMN
jgi:hypothetical protein